MNNEDNKYLFCACGNRLAETCDGSPWKTDENGVAPSCVIIRGMHGTEYRIGLVNAQIICKCGAAHVLDSGVLEETAEEAARESAARGIPKSGAAFRKSWEIIKSMKGTNPFFLQPYWRNRLLARLTEKQKQAYRIMSEKTTSVGFIAKELGLPIEIARKTIYAVFDAMADLTRERRSL